MIFEPPSRLSCRPRVWHVEPAREVGRHTTPEIGESRGVGFGVVRGARGCSGQPSRSTPRVGFPLARVPLPLPRLQRASISLTSSADPPSDNGATESSSEAFRARSSHPSRNMGNAPLTHGQPLEHAPSQRRHGHKSRPDLNCASTSYCVACTVSVRHSHDLKLCRACRCSRCVPSCCCPLCAPGLTHRPVRPDAPG